MSNGGAIAQRGFIFQSIIAMIECLERDDWDEIKMEPETELDKVDFVLRRNGAILSAIQVKSSINSFSDTAVKHWLEKLIEDAPDAEEYCLYLVGDSFTDDCKDYIGKHRKEIKTFSFDNLQEICTGKLVEYVRKRGLSGSVTIDGLNLLDDSLFASIHKNSIVKEPMSHTAFESAFQRALQSKSNYASDSYSESKSDTISASEKNKEEYYDYVLEQYKKRNEGNELLGEESLENLYMQPSYYKSKEEFDTVEQLFDRFISKGESGVLWIVGEPGHGKTSMCIKAVADYVLKKRYQQVSGVFWFRLNPHDVPEMIGNQKLSLEKVFSWGLTDDNRDKTFKLDEMKGGLVLLDGFDELKSSLEKNDILDNQFHTQANQLAERYKLHIVITSRTRALEHVYSCGQENLISGSAEIKCEFRDGGSRKNAVKLLAPLTNEEQLIWINELIKLRKKTGKDTSDLERYRQTFQLLQKNKDVKGLLEIPILLRMIVQNFYEPSSGNRVALYSELFDKTLLRQGIEGQRDRLHSVYRQIAFRIFVYDDDSAELNKGEFKDIADSDAYLYQYYLYTPEKGAGQDKEDKYRVTFLHRSFYQYFLSEFFYKKFEAITDVQSGKDFLKYLWPRRIDKYILDNFHYRKKDVSLAYKCVLKAIEETDAILSDYENVSDSKEYLGNYDKANNVFCNAISICNSLFQKESSGKTLLLTGRITYLLSKYDCSGIFLRLSSLNKATLIGANLIGANLSRADLSGASLFDADLSDTDLSGANLSESYLIGADLRGSDLRRADLRSADLNHTNLSEANLRGADLRYADLSGADVHDAFLSDTNLRNANLNGSNLSCTDMSGADLRNADLHCANLNGADLRGIKSSGATLSGAKLLDADLLVADFLGADLCGADLRSANLTGANLVGADLCDADLRGVELFGANLKNAKVSRSQYAYISIKDVKNLDRIIVVDDE